MKTPNNGEIWCRDLVPTSFLTRQICLQNLQRVFSLIGGILPEFNFADGCAPVVDYKLPETNPPILREPFR